MQSLSNKDSDRTTADSFATLFGNRISMWFSTNQPQNSLSKNMATELETTAEHHYHAKLSESQYQEQDSSSTLSTGQSHHEAATSARSTFYTQRVPFEPVETHKEGGEDCLKPSLPCGNAYLLSHQVQMEHNQSLDWMSYPSAGPYFGRITAAYEPNAVVYPQTMGVAPARVVLPLNCTQGSPIYVNAKQYHAILRRRQTRARLEAQNKVPKSRKPYLHESRHRHALRRARGSGGRFLNSKNVQQPRPASQTCGKNLVRQTIKEPKIQDCESNSWGTSTTSGSDVSCIFNNDDIFHQPYSRVSNSSLTMGVTAHIGARSRMAAPNDVLVLSIDRCAQISTAT